MLRPTELSVNGMFGQIDHHIKLREDAITILTGPNGCGKTHVLNTLKGMVGLDFTSVAKLPVQRTRLAYSSGDAVTLTIEGDEAVVSTRVRQRSYPSLRFPVGANTQDDVPTWLERMDPTTWFNRRTGAIVSDEQIARRYQLARVPTSEQQWFPHLKPAAEPILIATARLNTFDPSPERESGRPGRERPEAVGRIQQYVDQISALILEAKRASLANSQRADRQFAARALDKARLTIKEAELRNRYKEVASLHQAFHANSLTEESIDVIIPGKTTPTERRILNVFLDDWEEKLAPLRPVHEKIQLLREIVGSKMNMKYMQFDKLGKLGFVSTAGEPISVDMLSSGEQHLLALYTLLLFNAEPGSLVLIDEPEISLHAAWKHAFLGDISRVAALNSLQVVIATHSTAIINGQWDLVEELGLGA